MLYSEDPSTAILASCGGIDIARPDDLQQMEVTYGSNERVKQNLPILQDLEGNSLGDDCQVDFSAGI